MNHLTSEQRSRLKLLREMLLTVPAELGAHLISLQFVDPLAAVRERAMHPGLSTIVRTRTRKIANRRVDAGCHRVKWGK